MHQHQHQQLEDRWSGHPRWEVLLQRGLQHRDTPGLVLQQPQDTLGLGQPLQRTRAQGLQLRRLLAWHRSMRRRRWGLPAWGHLELAACLLALQQQ